MRSACKRLRLLPFLQPARYASTGSPASVVDEIITFVREHRTQNKHQEALDVLQSGLTAQKGNKTGVSVGRCGLQGDNACCSMLVICVTLSVCLVIVVGKTVL